MALADKITMPLEHGQRLSRDEFLRRWEAMPELKRAELIGGVVYLPSPVGLPHSKLTLALSAWIGTYEAATPGCLACSNATWFMLTDSPQPDVAMFIRPEYGGTCRYEGNFVSGAPELAIEVSATTRSYDFGPKLRLYREAGAGEYLSVVSGESQVVWRSLRGGAYVPIEPGPGGIVRSQVFPGLWLNAAALFAGDTAALLATLHQGLASPEHARFATGLAARRG